LLDVQELNMKIWNTIKILATKVVNAVSSLFAKSESSIKSELATIDTKLENVRASHSAILNKIADKHYMIQAAQGQPQARFIQKTANRLITSYTEKENKIKDELNFWQHKREQYINKHATKLAENITSTIPTITFEL
jgi:ABC-type Zn2+ transport system substrate-binding protein/surface adhesin